jgi:hypothetical protein
MRHIKTPRATPGKMFTGTGLSNDKTSHMAYYPAKKKEMRTTNIPGDTCTLEQKKSSKF